MVGNRVFGLAPGCLGTSVIVLADLMTSMPPQLSFAEAATAPTAYLTVLTAFEAMGGSQSLCHGAKVCRTRRIPYRVLPHVTSCCL